MLTRAPSFPWAVGPLAIAAAVAVLDLKALGLFPTRGTVSMVRILKKKEKNPQNVKVKDDRAKMSESLQLTSADSFKSEALNPGSGPQTQATRTNKALIRKG